MFCPVCKSEYRPGFTRCATCDVDLVTELPPEGAPTASRAPAERASLGPLVDYCGFLSLDDARDARDRLRREHLPTEIAIRDASVDATQQPVSEEYWLRVPLRAYDAAKRILGYDTQDEPGGEDSDEATCSECGASVAQQEAFCPHCGASFE